MSRRQEILLIIGITLLAFVLRAFWHGTAPVGWRDDELSNALVVSQHVLDGEVRLYYDDASGHEGLYHWFQAGTMAVFGAGVWGIRGVSILFGTLTVSLTYLLARRMFGWKTAAIAALLLATSFWSLMYSRSGQRHISVLVTTLISFYLLWGAFKDDEEKRSSKPFILAGVAMGLGFYTYFASRGVPLIIIAWGGYLLIWRRDLWRSAWRGLGLIMIITIIIALPLIITLQNQPEAEARVAELAKPVYDARDGDFSTLGAYTLTTLSMFTHDGDDEVLYNLPHRPVFGIVGGLLFWAGVLIALYRTFGAKRDHRSAFLLLWLGAGLSPGVLSVPAASLGHTLLAQPAVMIFVGVGLVTLWEWVERTKRLDALLLKRLAISLTMIFLMWEGVRGTTDYFIVWPADSFNRVLHHSDIYEGAKSLKDSEPGNVAIGSFLTERWDQQVADIALDGEGWRIRAYDPRSTYLMIPGGGRAIIPEYLIGDRWDDAPGDFGVYSISEPNENMDSLALFDNGLTLLDLQVGINDSEQAVIITGWRAESLLDLPPFVLLSKPPAPDEDDTSRLAIFIQLLDGEGNRIAGADGLGVDPYTLYADDVFYQRFFISVADVPAGEYRLVVGLYDPFSGSRHIDQETGADFYDAGTVVVD